MKGKMITRVFVFSLLFLTGCFPAIKNITGGGAENTTDIDSSESILRVQVSSSAYSFVRPWDRKKAKNRNGLGVVVENGFVLVTAYLVADSTYIMLQKNDGGPKSPAIIRQVDYSANLALLEPVDPSFLTDSKSLPIRESIEVREKVEVFFGKKDGKHERLPGRVQEIEVGYYPFLSKMLLSRIKVDLPSATESYSLPIVKDGTLCGLGMKYNNKSETMTSVSLPVIHHFIDDLADGNYEGFPFLGIDFSVLDDDQLRSYLNLKDKKHGIYLYRVRPGSPASTAGLLPGDVLLTIDGHEIDRFGKYKDDVLGPIHISYYISCARFSGDTITLELFRHGKKIITKVQLAAADYESSPIPSYLEGRPPRYLILGGLVLTELSRQYLQEWGPQWAVKAPESLVHYYLNQWELLKADQRVVLLSHVLPTRAMIGYTDFDNMILQSVNNEEITRLEDVVEALKEPLGRFHQLRFLKDKKEIYIDRFTLEKENNFIRSRYGIPRLQQLNDKRLNP